MRRQVPALFFMGNNGEADMIDNLKPPAMLGRSEKDVSGMRK